MRKLYARPLLATILAAVTVIGPISPALAQEPTQNPPASAAQSAPLAPQSTNVAPVANLGLGKHDFSHGPAMFPNLIAPYKPIHIEKPDLVNAPRIDQLIHDGKLELTLQDAVELALENSLDIAVQRYYPWIADTGKLKAASGGSPGATPGAQIGGSTAFISGGTVFGISYDPLLTQTVAFGSQTTPVNNPFISGTGTTSNGLIGLTSHESVYDTAYSQSFVTGTSVSAAWNNTRSSSNSGENFFNPSVQSSLTLGVTQELMNGFGSFVGRRNIIIANNNRKIADLAFTAQAITTVTNTVNAYWELVYARENVKVEQQAVSVSEKLYNDNKKQLEIGTMAPLDVTRAESELASDRQNLIVARTTQLQDEQVLKNAITKDPLAANLLNVEIAPSDLPSPPAAIEAPSFEAAIQEAFTKRPDLQEQVYNLKNADVDVRATKNALLPTLTLSGQYSSSGLGGNSVTGTPLMVSSGSPIVDQNGVPILVGGNEVFTSTTTLTNPVTKQGGFGTSQNQLFTNRFPSYYGQLTLQLPLRNRSAQADNARAILTQRQMETAMQQLKNAALLDVRNTYIALEQDRARVDAAIKARQLQKETFEAEQKKYQLGASTVYNVILTQRDYVTAEGTELRALADLVEAKANYERAVGRTLEINHVTIADAKSGVVQHDSLIPGTANGQVIGADKLFSGSGQK